MGPEEADDVATGSADPADALDDRLRELHDHLAATAERPLETEANRWLGEAEAVAADVADGDASEAAIATRVGQVGELLSHVEGTGDTAADEHVEAARELAAAIEGDLDG